MTYDDLMYALLSMVAYEHPGAGLNKVKQIGTANFVRNSEELPDGFFAVSYNYNGQTVIAYRGTDGNT